MCASPLSGLTLFIGYYNKLRNISGNGNVAKCLGMGNSEKGNKGEQGGVGGANWARPLLLVVLCASKQNGSILLNKLTTGLFLGRKTMALALVMAMPMWRHLIGFLCNLLSHFLLNGDIHQRNREIRDHFRLRGHNNNTYHIPSIYVYIDLLHNKGF